MQYVFNLFFGKKWQLVHVCFRGDIEIEWIDVQFIETFHCLFVYCFLVGIFQHHGHKFIPRHLMGFLLCLAGSIGKGANKKKKCTDKVFHHSKLDSKVRPFLCIDKLCNRIAKHSLYLCRRKQKKTEYGKYFECIAGCFGNCQ